MKLEVPKSKFSKEETLEKKKNEVKGDKEALSMSNLALQAEVTELHKKLKGIPFLTWYIENENISWQKKRKELKMANKIEKAVEQKCAEMKEGQNPLKITQWSDTLLGKHLESLMKESI